MIQFNRSARSGKSICQTLDDDPVAAKSQVGIDVLRLDKIHTIISGNKWFKLKYYLDDAFKTGKKELLLSVALTRIISLLGVCLPESGMDSIRLV